MLKKLLIGKLISLRTKQELDVSDIKYTRMKKKKLGTRTKKKHRETYEDRFKG